LNSLKIKIGGVIIAARGDSTGPAWQAQQEHRPFLVEEGTPDVILQVHYGAVPHVDFQDKVFECEGPCSLYRHGGQLVLAMPSPVLGGPPYRLAIMDPSWGSGDIYIDASVPLAAREGPGPASCVDPFAYPLDEVLMINFLARRRLGMVTHACGLSDQGRGLVFCGVSGAGKSTLARLWEKTGVTLLSDDRIILRRQEPRALIYDTPWHGDANIASPQGAPLERLYFISHASCNRLSPLAPREAASRLLVRCFPPFYDRQGMDNTLEIISWIVERIPCYDLGFVPDESITALIRDHYAAG
jgi:hypothetical protein